MAAIHADAELLREIQNASGWDVAVRYHDLSGQLQSARLRDHLRHVSAAEILQRAQALLGSLVHPRSRRVSRSEEVPPEAQQIEIDLEETIENNPFILSGQSADVWLDYTVHKARPIVVTADTSLSMTGQKLALTAVALAVVLLEFPDDPVGLVAFENEATVLKYPTERVSVQTLVERFLDVPAQGYTHLEDGLRKALTLAREAEAVGGGARSSTVLLTDGKYTAGRDPGFLGHRFSQLVVLKMGNEKASLPLCRELARKGQGSLHELTELERLPSVMLSIVRDLLRGRSIA